MSKVYSNLVRSDHIFANIYSIKYKRNVGGIVTLNCLEPKN